MVASTRNNLAVTLEGKQQLEFFLDHLHRIHCAKKHMVRSFKSIGGIAHFADLKLAIDETHDDVNNQIERIEQIFEMLGSVPLETSCAGIISMLEEAYAAALGQKLNQSLRDLSILFYMQTIESIEVASFKMLLMVADCFSNTKISQLLLENYDEAKEDRALFFTLSQKYLKKN